MSATLYCTVPSSPFQRNYTGRVHMFSHLSDTNIHMFSHLYDNCLIPFNSSFPCLQLYKGRLENGTYVAIRSLTFLKKHSIQNLKVRLDFLSKLQHPHLVSLLGHCIESGSQDDSNTNKVFLVYEYIPNGSYRTHLSGQCSTMRIDEYIDVKP